MDDTDATSLEQIRAFLAGTADVRFSGQRRAEVYAWVERTVVRHEYAGLSREGKGLVRQYVGRMTGLSRAQVTRLIAGYRQTGSVKSVAYQRTKFATRYTAGDIALLAYVDKAHGNLSGPATQRILDREHGDYGRAAYQRLAKISPTDAHRPWKTIPRFPHSHSADDFYFLHQTKKKGPSLTHHHRPRSGSPFDEKMLACL